LPAYLVGGPLRDVLLGFPVQDLDFVVEGDAPALARALARELGGEAIVHQRFGTATVALGDSHIDVVTARRETYPRPGDLPQVTPGTIQEDLARRDFTINSLAIALAEQRPGIMDLLGGVDDLAKGLVRILHPGSFIDDPTRIMRAVRYEQRFGFTLEAGTLAQLQVALAGGCLDTVSGDRLRHEMERTLEEEDPLPALLRAAELGVLAAIHPALGESTGLARLADHPADTQEARRYAGPLVYLAALVYHVSSVSSVSSMDADADAEGLVRHLNLPGSWARVVRDTMELRRREEMLEEPSLAPSRIYDLLQGLAGPAVAAAAVLSSSDRAARRLAQYTHQLVRVRPVLGGRDLLEMGVPEGPRVGELLQHLRRAKLDGKVLDAEDERRMVRRMLSGKKGR
jgi:tRNA nucleotidyltransferase (CCA-adding enzyme)